MFSSLLKFAKPIPFLIFLALTPSILRAQSEPSEGAATVDSTYKWDIFAGYSNLSSTAAIGSANSVRVKYGFMGSVTGYLNRFAGLQIEGDFHNDGNESTPNFDFAGGSAGGILRFPVSNFTPFAHALLGAESTGSYYYNNAWGLVATSGGGLDYTMPWFNHQVAIRVVQVDYQFTQENFSGDARNFNLVRLSAGVVFHCDLAQSFHQMFHPGLDSF